MSNGNLPPGVNLTPFDIDPQLGTHILDAVLAGVQQKKEEAASKLAEKHKQIDEKLSLIGELFRTNPAGALKLAQMDPSLAAMVPGIKDIPAPPPSEAQQRSEEISKLPPDQRREALVPEVGAAESRSKQLHQKMLQDELNQFPQYRKDVGFRRQWKDTFGTDLPSGPTMSERELGISSGEFELRKKKFDADQMALAAGGYQIKPGVDAKVGQESLKHVIDAVLHNKLATPDDLANVIPTDDYVKIMTAKHTISPATMIALDRLREINSERGRNPKTHAPLPLNATQQKDYDLYTAIVRSDAAFEESLKAGGHKPDDFDPGAVTDDPHSPGFFDKLFGALGEGVKALGSSGLGGGGAEAAAFDKAKRLKVLSPDQRTVIEGVKRRYRAQGRTDSQIDDAEDLLVSAAEGNVEGYTLAQVVKELTAPTRVTDAR